MMGTLVLLAGALLPVVMNEIDAEKGMETAIRLTDLERGIQAYFWDTGRLPPQSISGGSLPVSADLLTGLVYLFYDDTPGWRGPYSSYTPEFGLRDPWRTPFIYRTGNISGIPVVLVGSLGRNRQLDTDLSRWPNTPVTNTGDDLLRVFELDRLSEFQDEKTINVLNLNKSILYNTFTSPPGTYHNASMIDAWGTPVRYHRCDNNVAVLFSLGYNRVDESGAGADICASRRSGGDDLFVWLVW